MTARKPSKKKTYPSEKARLKKKGVATGKDRYARRSRRKSVSGELKKLQGTTIRNTATGREVKVTKSGIQETAHHAKGDTLSTIAALDAKRQIRDAKPVRTDTAKTNKRQRKMHIEEMTIMKGKLLSAGTKVLTGKTSDGSTVLYSITAKQKRRKK